MPTLFFQTTSRSSEKQKKSYSQGNYFMVLLFASIFFDIALILAFGRFQAVGTLDFPDRLYPIWKWAVGAGVLYTLKPAIIVYVSYSSVSLLGCLLIFAISSATFALYFKLLRANTDKPTQHRSIYWGVGIASAFLLSFV
jgi:hypothetical protein